MLILELLIVLVGIIVFIMQSKLRYPLSQTSRKIVYWTVMFFMSLSFNTILFNNYGSWYNLETYLNLNTLFILVAITLGYCLIQFLSPFKYFRKLIKSFSKDTKTDKTINSEDTYEETKTTRQLHFEVFLETICWIGFISIFMLECYINFLTDLNPISFLEGNFILVLCLMVMITLPITLRQIFFYLLNIREIKETSLSNEEIMLNKKLNKENIKL